MDRSVLYGKAKYRLHFDLQLTWINLIVIIVACYPSFFTTPLFIFSCLHVCSISVNEVTPFRLIKLRNLCPFSQNVLSEQCGINPSKSEALIYFYSKGLLGLRPTTKLEDQPLSAVRYCLFIQEKMECQDFHNFYCSPIIVRVMKSSRKGWAEHVTRMGDEHCIHFFLNLKRSFGKPRRRWEDNITS
jgi:hypothetical protein